MKAFLGLLLCAGLSFLHAPAQAQQRLYHQAELDALLAPVALYPDGLLSQILMAATYPEDVSEVARWSRDNPQLAGQDAVRAVAPMDWDPSVKSLVAFPDVLARMGESPQWTRDLGEAFLLQEPHVMDTVQGLRQRAHAAGHLQTNEHYSVQRQGEAIAVYPAHAGVVYVHHYNPYVVYGPWWWPAYQPVFWHPWAPRPVYVTRTFFYGAPDWHHRHVRVVHRPYYVRSHAHVVPGRWQHRPSARAYVRVPEANRRPIINSAPQQIRSGERQEQRQELRQEQSRERRAPATMRESPSQPERRSAPERERRGGIEQRQQLQRQAQMPAAPGFSQGPRVEQRREAKRETGRETRKEARREAPRQQRETREQRGNGRG